VNGVGFSRATGSCQEYRAAMLDGIESGGLFGIKRHPVLVFGGAINGCRHFYIDALFLHPKSYFSKGDAF